MQKIYIILKDITESGGGERVCVNLSNAFSEIGFEVHILSLFRLEKNIAFSLSENINVRFLSHTTPKSKNPLKKFFNKSIYRYILSKKIDKIIQQEKPDIVLANDGWYIPKTKLDSIQYIRLWHLKAPKKIDKRKQKIFNLFDTLVVLSSRELNKWQNYHRNVKVIPNFLPNISAKNTDSNQHRIISVGRLSAEKGFLRLIDIWEKVRERIKATHCCIKSSPCHVERSETSKNLESKKDISTSFQNNSHEKNLESKQTSAEVSLSDFSGFQSKGEESYLEGNDLALSAESAKSTTCAKHQSKPAKETTHKKNLESWQLIIVGSGPMQEQIESKIKEKNLQDSIILKPFTKDIEKEYLNASIYAMTSHFEGFPMVLLESCSYALCPIAFNVATGPSDIIESHTSGYLIDDNDLQDYADKLLALMSDKEKRESMGLQAKQKVSIAFSKEAVMKLWQGSFQ